MIKALQKSLGVAADGIAGPAIGEHRIEASQHDGRRSVRPARRDPIYCKETVGVAV